MIVVCAADHAGLMLKDYLVAALAARGVMTLDFGTHGSKPVDYPDYAHRVCDLLKRGSEYGCVGMLICGSGVGMAMAANRHHHIRCAVVTTVEAALLARRHNDANVLALGARVVGAGTALAILNVFLATSYEGGRHDLRLAKLEPVGD